MIRQPSARATRWTTVVALLVALPAASCDKLRGKDEGKCTRSLAYARQALEQESFELVRQYREYVYKHCDNPGQLDEEIKAKYAAIAERKTKNARAAQVAQLFTDFAAKHVAAPKGQCFSGGPDAGWCKRSQGLSGASSSFDVRYKQQNPSWARFDTVIDGAIGCNHLGASQVRAWRATLPTGGITKRSHCAFSGGPLNGFNALVSVEDDGTRVSLVSPIYLSNDPLLRKVFESEGM